MNHRPNELIILIMRAKDSHPLGQRVATDLLKMEKRQVSSRTSCLTNSHIKSLRISLL